jgi:hypothetical protein
MPRFKRFSNVPFKTAEAFATHAGPAVLRRRLDAGDRVQVCTKETCGYSGCRGFQWALRFQPEWEDAIDVSDLREDYPPAA